MSGNVSMSCGKLRGEQLSPCWNREPLCPLKWLFPWHYERTLFTPALNCLGTGVSIYLSLAISPTSSVSEC